MSIAAVSAELHASRRWVMFMAILALVLLGLWCLVATTAWFLPDVMPDHRGWQRYFFLGFYGQLTLYVYAAIIPFVGLLRYARALGALKEGDRAGLIRAIELHGTFWRQCSLLMWGMVWLFVYAVAGGVAAAFLPAR